MTSPDNLEDLASLIQPDKVPIEALFPPSRATDPYHDLFKAVLLNGIHCLNNGKTWDRQDAEFWIMAGVESDVFSFTNVCHVLNLDPGYMRSRLAKKYALQGNPEPPKPKQFGPGNFTRAGVVPRFRIKSGNPPGRRYKAKPERRCNHYSYKTCSMHNCRRGLPHRCYCCEVCSMKCALFKEASREECRKQGSDFTRDVL